MDSSTNRKQTEEQKQAELRRQIAALQAQLKDDPTLDVSVTPKKRKQKEHSLLAPATPSPSMFKSSSVSYQSISNVR